VVTSENVLIIFTGRLTRRVKTLNLTGIHSLSDINFRQETIARLRSNGERKFKDDSAMFYLKSEVFYPSTWVPTPAESIVFLNVFALPIAIYLISVA